MSDMADKMEPMTLTEPESEMSSEAPPSKPDIHLYTTQTPNGRNNDIRLVWKMVSDCAL